MRVLDTGGLPIKETEIIIKGPGGERKNKTDANGYVLLRDAREGKYQITSKDPQFKDVKQEVEVKKRAGAATEGGEEGVRT